MAEPSLGLSDVFLRRGPSLCPPPPNGLWVVGGVRSDSSILQAGKVRSGSPGQPWKGSPERQMVPQVEGRRETQ